MNHFKGKFKNSIYITKSNIAMLILSIYYLSICFYSMYYHSMGYYFIPEHRERYIKILMVFILVVSFLILSPDKETHKISLFTVIIMSILCISTGLFIKIMLKENLRYNASQTLILCSVSLFLSVFCGFFTIKSYDTTDFFKENIFASKKELLLKKIISALPRVLNTGLVLFFIIFFSVTGIKGKLHTQPNVYSISKSPGGTYVARTEQINNDDGTSNIYICVYEIHKDIKVFIGKWTYDGSPVYKVEVPDYSNMNYQWLSEYSFVAKGTTYTFK